MNINKQLKNLRENKNYKQKNVYEYLDVDKSTYSKYEKGTLQPSIDVLKKLAKFYNVSTDYILGINESKNIFLNSKKLTQNEIKNYLENDIVFMNQVERIVNIPVLESISTGLPELSDEDNIDEYEITMLPSYGNKKGFFYLKIKGESMEPTLYENDYALVYATKDIKNNDIVVVGLNGNEALIKRYQCYENGDCWLIADNPKYQPLKLEEDHQPYIIGKVIESKKKFYK